MRDAVEWMLPPLWPWKVLMLPARGPRPKLKSETVLTLRLMEDVDIPQIAATSSSTTGWHYFGQSQPGSYRMSPRNDAQSGRLQLSDPSSMSTREVLPSGEHTFYLTYATKDGVPISDLLTVPGMPVFVLSKGSMLAVSGYAFLTNHLSYVLASGDRGIVSGDEVDWAATILCLAEMSAAESGGIVSRPKLNSEPTFDQESLSMAHTCLLAEPLDSMFLTSKGRTDIYRYIRMGGKAVALGRPIVTVM